MTLYTFNSEKQKDKNIKKSTWFCKNIKLYSDWEIIKIKVFKLELKPNDSGLHKKCVW